MDSETACACDWCIALDRGRLRLGAPSYRSGYHSDRARAGVRRIFADHKRLVRAQRNHLWAVGVGQRLRGWLRGLPEGEGLVLLLAFAVAIACISPFPDGANGARWALLSLIPFIARPSWPALAIPATAAISLAWSPDPLTGLDLAWHFTVLALIAVAAPADLSRVWWALGLGMAVNSVFVALQLAGFEPVSHRDGIFGAGLFFNRNTENNAAVLAVVALATLRDWRAWVLAPWVSLPLFAPPVSRTGLISLAAVGAAGIAHRHRWLALPGMVAVVILLLWLVGAGNRLGGNFQRIDTWTEATANLTFWGHGLGSFRHEFPGMEFAHNDALQIAYELGPLWVVVCAALVCYILWISAPGPRLVLVAFLVEGLFDFALYQPVSGMVAALCVGAALRGRTDLRRRISDRQLVDRTSQIVA